MVKAIGKRMAGMAGIVEEEVAGRLWRVGGAIDLRDTLGMEGGASMIKERGRWASDVAFVYARALAGQQMDAAAGMGDARTGRWRRCCRAGCSRQHCADARVAEGTQPQSALQHWAYTRGEGQYGVAKAEHIRRKRATP